MRKSVLSAVVFPSLVVGLSLSHAQSPPGTRPETLRTALTVERDPAGNADLVLKTGRGYGYALETTPDLAVGNWSPVLDLYGLGQEARFRVLTNTNPPPGSTPTPPPIPSFTFQLVALGNGDVLISWSEGGTLHSVVQTRVFPEILSPIWQQRVDVAPAGDGPEDYLLTLAALQVSYEPQATPPTNPPPTTTVLERLTEVWAQLDSGQTSGAGGASIPGANASDFFRCVVSTPDSDGDCLADWLEFGLDPSRMFSNPFLADSDGDGFDDYAEYLAGTQPDDSSSRPYDSAHPPSEADLWVDASFNPSPYASDGSRDFPFKTIQAAIAAATPGAVIAVRQGLYTINVDPTYDIRKPVTLVAVEGPRKTLVDFVNDEVGQLVRISDPDFRGGLYDGPGHSWIHHGPVVGESEDLPANPMTVQFHGFRFYTGYKAPTFFVLPGVRLVFANCYLNSLLCGVAECHSSELVMLNCQVAENGDLTRRNETFTTLAPGIVYLRGKARADIWHCTFSDNVKEPLFGTIHLEGNATARLRNSVLWEQDNPDLGSTPGAGANNLTPGGSDAFDSRRRAVLTWQDEAGSLAPPTYPTVFQADVQSCLLFDSLNGNGSSAPPAPPGGSPNLDYITAGTLLLEKFNDTAGNDRVKDLRTRRLRYDSAYPPPPADGVTSAALDTSTGLVGPKGFAHLLRYDLEGHARHPAFRRNPPAPAPLTPVDVGAVEIVPTLRDYSYQIQRPWSDLTTVTSAPTGEVRVVATGPYLDENSQPRQPGRLLTIESFLGRTGLEEGDFLQVDLPLDGLGTRSTIAAACFDPAAGRFFALADQRRGGGAFPGFPGVATTSRHLGCRDGSADLLGTCLYADYNDETLRACHVVVPASPSDPLAAALRQGPTFVNLSGYLGSSGATPSPSPTRFQETTGLRAAFKARLLAASTGTFEASLKPVDAYGDGLVIVFNTVPKFGLPVDGVAHALTVALPYDGGGPTDTAGTVIHVHTGPSALFNLSFPFDASAHLTLDGNRRELFFRAWPFRNGPQGRLYGPAYNASVVLDGRDGNPDGVLDPQPFPLVINEVMSGSQGWVEIFNTWGVNYTVPNGVFLKVHATEDPQSLVTAQCDLSGRIIPARGVRVAARSPVGQEFPLVRPGGGLITIADSGNVRFDLPAGLSFDASESFVGRDRTDGSISEGRAWDGGPRGKPVPGDPTGIYEGAAFDGPSGLQKATRSNFNTTDYTDTFSSAVVRQPYFQAVANANANAATVYLSWRNTGHLGATWDGDGQRPDFASMRVEGAAFNGGNLVAGLRMPLTDRKSGSAFVMTVPSTAVSGALGQWGAITATSQTLDLRGQGIRAITWSPHVEGGRYLIVGGPASTDPTLDHPSVARYSLWSWSGSGAPVLRIPDLAPYAKRPSGVATFTIPNVTGARIAFSENETSWNHSREAEHILHWPVSVLGPAQ